MGQPINHTAAPPLRSLPGENVLPDRPVEQNQLAIHGEGSPNLCETDASPKLLEQFRVTGGERSQFSHEQHPPRRLPYPLRPQMVLLQGLYSASSLSFTLPEGSSTPFLQQLLQN
jgi:hypothetical protein